jgi:hypothetical protein
MVTMERKRLIRKPQPPAETNPTSPYDLYWYTDMPENQIAEYLRVPVNRLHRLLGPGPVETCSCGRNIEPYKTRTEYREAQESGPWMCRDCAAKSRESERQAEQVRRTDRLYSPFRTPARQSMGFDLRDTVVVGEIGLPGEMRLFTVLTSSYGHYFIDVRKWFWNQAEGRWQPTTKGIRIPTDAAEDIAEAIMRGVNHPGVDRDGPDPDWEDDRSRPAAISTSGGRLALRLLKPPPEPAPEPDPPRRRLWRKPTGA